MNSAPQPREDPQAQNAFTVPPLDTRDVDGQFLRHPGRYLAVSALLAGATASYFLVGSRGVPVHWPTADVLTFISLCFLGNSVTAIRAISLDHSVSRRLPEVLSTACLAHGLVALYILISRSYYSIPITLLAFIASALIGVVALSIRPPSKIRIAIVGPITEGVRGLLRVSDHITDPAQSLNRYDLVLLTFEEPITAEWTKGIASSLLAGKPVRHAAEFMEERQGRVSIEHFDIDHVSAERLRAFRQVKRWLEVLIVIAVTPLALFVLLIATVWIKCESRGPALFLQQRVGLGGRVFTIFKLRTMAVSARNYVPEVATAIEDPRITDSGRILRRFRIDELPQLLNVLRGEMSLIGPRPEQPALVARYTASIPGYAIRHIVRPGITGWAQVNAGYAADASETREKLAYDLFYIKNMGLALDTRILFRTIVTLALGTGVR